MVDRVVVDVGEKTAVTVFSPSTSLLGGVMVDDSPLWLAWEGARAAWLESKRRKSGSQNTVKSYDFAVKQFFEWAAVAPWMVSAALAQNWVIYLAQDKEGKAGNKDSTINAKLAALSSFYEFVQRRYTTRTADGRDVTLWPTDRRNPSTRTQQWAKETSPFCSPTRLPANAARRF